MCSVLYPESQEYLQKQACFLQSGVTGSGRKFSACPSVPWVKGSFGTPRDMGSVIPFATGISVLPNISNTFNALMQVTSAG